jgi:hypothetical protein
MKRLFFSLLLVMALLAFILPVSPVVAAPPPPPPQTPLNSTSIPQFVDPLPALRVITGAHDTDANQIELRATEFQSKVLPASFYAALPAPYNAGTYVWGYLEPSQVGNPAAIPSYLGPVVVATRNQPTQIKFVNNLGTTVLGQPNTTKVLAYLNSTDQSLHWANPNGDQMMVTNPFPPPAMVGNPNHYGGAIPMVPHLHGGEQPAAIDGGPEQWFTSDGAKHGLAFYTKDGSSSNYATFRYPNVQQAAPLWFHDHTLGATRLNVYAGLAGGYVLTDPNQ